MHAVSPHEALEAPDQPQTGRADASSPDADDRLRSGTALKSRFCVVSSRTGKSGGGEWRTAGGQAGRRRHPTDSVVFCGRRLKSSMIGWRPSSECDGNSQIIVFPLCCCAAAECADHVQPDTAVLLPLRVCTTRATEHDACGVGFVVHMKGTAVARHRAKGAAGADQSRAPRRLRLRGEHRRRRRHPDPDARRVSSGRSSRSRCPPPARTAPAWCSCRTTSATASAIKELIARIVAEEGQTLLGWRDVPTDNRLVGDSARATQPVFQQVFIGARVRRSRTAEGRAAVRAQAVRDPQARRARRRSR